MANINSSLMEKVFNTPKRERKETYIMTASWTISGDVLK